MSEKCDHILGLHNQQNKGQSPFHKDKIELLYYEDVEFIDWFNYCPTCGEKLEVKDENNSTN